MERPHKDDEKVVHLVNVRNLVHLTMVEDALKSEGIEYTVKQHESMAYDGLFTISQGFGDVYVFQSDLEKAKAVVKELESNSAGEEE